MRKEVPLAVEVPSPERDKPAWVKVGVIAAVGFIVGIAWPRLVGVRLGPSAPGESASAAASASGAAGRAPDAPPASAAGKMNAPMASATAASATTTAATVALPPKIVVTKGIVVTCKTTDGDKKTGKECGPVAGLDMLVRDKVKGIATCGGVEGQTGKFSLTANADFKSGRFWYDVNKGSTVQNIDAITSCLKNAFHGQAVTNVPHEHPRYTVQYSAVLSAEKEDAAAANKAKTEKDKSADKTEKAVAEKAPEKSEEESKPAPPAAAGEANVAWEVALVRDAPKVGAVVARLPRGTKVKLGAMKEGWYSVKFGDDFSSDGWVYRGAVGR